MAGGEWWGLKSERKRHVKKDEEIWKEVEKKWDQGDCTFSLFLALGGESSLIELVENVQISDVMKLSTDISQT